MNAPDIIMQAMLKVVRQHSFEKITVQMILDEAQVSRSTFYRYYNDKYDLVNQYYQNHVRALYETHHSWHECMGGIYQFMGENRIYFSKVLEIEGPHSFWEFFYQFSFKYTETCFLQSTKDTTLPEQDRVTMEFFIMGQVFIVKQWLKKGASVPPETMAEWAYQLTPEKYRDCLDPI